jgi:hypothetical protein
MGDERWRPCRTYRRPANKMMGGTILCLVGQPQPRAYARAGGKVIEVTKGKDWKQEWIRGWVIAWNYRDRLVPGWGRRSD